MKPNDVAIRKRTQIAQANKTMFIWIAMASALVGSAVVVSVFLAQKAIFNEKVLMEKQKTVSALDNNNKVAPELEDQIRVLDTNQALISSKANEDDQAIQVILDALPSEGNSLAVGASLQNKLLAGVPGLTSVQSLQVDPIVGLESLSTSTTTVDASATTGANEITFRLVVKGSQDAIKMVLQNFERSIRLIQITSLQIETQQDGQLMTVQAKAFYEPAKTIELQDKVVNP
ncbi:MAG: hypothetical protein JWN28_919 [Candidatus Saccharibacteria bacterium]|nr:hypothetical protein [Candidatus Saccharibacteria bacterium]